MSTKLLLLLIAAACLAVGTWLVLENLPYFTREGAVTIHNYDPPGLPYSLVALRAAPDSGSDRMGFLSPGASGRAIARDESGGWLLLDATLRGWISIALVDVSGSIDALPISEEELAPPIIPAVEALNPADATAMDVRLGPDAAFDTIRILEPGEGATAIARDATGEWLMIDPGGWVKAEGLEVSGHSWGLPVIEIRF